MLKIKKNNRPRRTVQPLLVFSIITIFLLSSVMISNAEQYEWTSWSNWQDTEVKGSSDREVETRDVIDSYTMETWVYSDSSSPSWRGYWPHSTGNTLRNHMVETWPKAWVDSARWVISANTYYDSPDNDNCDGMVHDQNAYVCVHGQGHDYVPFFIVGTNYKKQYRYRDRIIINTDIENAIIDSRTDPGTTKLSDNGGSIADNISVTLNGSTLLKGTDYTVSCDESVKTGPVKVTIVGKGSYNGSVTKTFYRVPGKAAVTKITAENNSMIVYWDQEDGADGYQVEYSLYQDFSSYKIITIKKTTTKKCTIRDLDGTGTYYVRIRTYRLKDGKKYCSGWSDIQTIYIAIDENLNFDLSKAKVNKISERTYTGKAIKPNPTIVNGSYVLVKGTDYTVKYKNNVKVGKATVIMTGKGAYYGTAKKTFRIIPKKTSVVKSKLGTKEITVRWKKVSGCSGYQIRWSGKSDFSSCSKRTVKGGNNTGCTLKGLKSGTTYYIQIRSFVTKGKTNYYSKWSKTKKLQTIKIKRAKGYVKILLKPVKAGKYYYKCKGAYVYRSKKAKSGYRKVGEFQGDAFTNGKYIYWASFSPGSTSGNTKYYLYRCSASGKNKKSVKKLPFKKTDGLGYWEIATIYKNNIYLTRGNGEDFLLYTYRYSMKSKKLTRIAKACGISFSYNNNTTRSGSYVLTDKYMETAGITAWDKSLFKITSSGKLKKIKHLGDSVDASFRGKKLYYVKFDIDRDSLYFSGDDSVYDMSLKVYSCNRDGSNRKLLGSFSDEYRCGCLHASDFGSKSCVIQIDDRKYDFYYASGDMWLKN